MLKELRDIPFMKITKYDVPRLWLPITINKKLRTYGLVDTGADECCLPAPYAAILGLDPQKGVQRAISTGNSKTLAYAHKVSIAIGSFEAGDIVVNFMPNLHVPLLGVSGFLDRFNMVLDYPRRKFSLQKLV